LAVTMICNIVDRSKLPNPLRKAERSSNTYELAASRPSSVRFASSFFFFWFPPCLVSFPANILAHSPCREDDFSGKVVTSWLLLDSTLGDREPFEFPLGLASPALHTFPLICSPMGFGTLIAWLPEFLNQVVQAMLEGSGPLPKYDIHTIEGGDLVIILFLSTHSPVKEMPLVLSNPWYPCNQQHFFLLFCVFLLL